MQHPEARSHTLAVSVSRIASVGMLLLIPVAASAQRSLTTLGNSDIDYTVPASGYHVLQQAGVTAVIVDNRDVDDSTLPGHRAGYSGVASLTHRDHPQNLFVPAYAGLNFEHIHDGTVQDRDVLFEPRRAPLELRVISPDVVELYQPPTPTWQLESALRYQMLADGTLELTVECIPRARTFRNGYIGLFWASYLTQPESLDIHFPGAPATAPDDVGWIRGITPAHGIQATHLSRDDDRVFEHDPQFPLTLVFNRSDYRYTAAWYYGVSHNMALVQMFRPQDLIRFSQSPSGGGQGNPAWDFQWLIPNYQVGQLYQMVMRAQYVPFESVDQLQQVTAPHRRALGQSVQPIVDSSQQR